MTSDFELNKQANRKYCPFQQLRPPEKCYGTSCAMFVIGETDGHCAFQILPQLVTELREINNREIPFSEEPAEEIEIHEYDPECPY